MSTLTPREPAGEGTRGTDLGGAWCSWWRGDPLPSLPPLPGFDAARVDEPALLSRLSGLGSREIEIRLWEGNMPYVAYVRGEPACYGWSAGRSGQISEISCHFQLPEGNRYLWDFVTLPEMRGRGVYPKLLQSIVEMEHDAERFWIGHDANNVPSGKGILKAGFQVACLVRPREGRLVMIAEGDRVRAAAAAAILRLPLLEAE